MFKIFASIQKQLLMAIVMLKATHLIFCIFYSYFSTKRKYGFVSFLLMAKEIFSGSFPFHIFTCFCICESSPQKKKKKQRIWDEWKICKLSKQSLSKHPFRITPMFPFSHNYIICSRFQIRKQLFLMFKLFYPQIFGNLIACQLQKQYIIWNKVYRVT